MKKNNRKYISLLAALAMLVAYAVPFQLGGFAEGGEIIWTFAEVQDGISLENSSGKMKEWYISDVDLGNGLTAYSNGTLNADKQEYSNAFEIDRTSIAEFDINGNTEEVTGALKFGGKSSSNGRYFTYTPSADGTLTAYVKHGSPSGTDTRTLTIAQGSNTYNVDVTAPDNSYVAGSTQVSANSQIKITVSGNVALAKLVFTPDSATPSETDEPEITDTPSETDVPGITDTPSETDAPGITDTTSEPVTPVKTPVPSEPVTPVITPAPSEPVTPVITPAPSEPVTPVITPVPTEEPSELSPDEQAVRADAESLTLKAVSQTAVYSDIDLDIKGANGSTITWESSNSDYIDIQMISHIKRNYTGVVTRPKAEECTENGGVPVTLTATLKKGSAEYKKTFNVSVRQWNPIYYNDFQADVGKAAEGTYSEIADNVVAANGSTFRGIRVDTLKESRCFASFGHGDKDTPQYFDKRVMSTKDYATPPDSNQEEENFAFYYAEYKAYGGSTTYNPLWIKLIDPETGTAPEGIVMLTMDIFVLPGKTEQRFNIGFGTSKASQMCRFLLYNGTNDKLGYTGGGLLRTFSNESSIEFMGGKSNYVYPVGEWVKATLIANSESHKWDFYFDGMQVATGMDFRNAEDIIPTIEFTMDRSYQGGAYFLDNIYVENMTDDYKDTYWEAFELGSVPYDESVQAYTVAKPFLLPYQGTDGLAGKAIRWSSSDSKVLSVVTQRVEVELLSEFGYTEEQIAQLKANGYADVSVTIATPNESLKEDKIIELTASMELGDNLEKKTFSVLVKANSSVDENSDSAKALKDANAISCVTDGETVTNNVTMETTGKINGSKITWKSSNASVFSTSGVVTRPSVNAVTVTLTAAVEYGDAVEYKTFNVTVSPKASNAGGGGGGGGTSVKGTSVKSIATSSAIVNSSANEPAQPVVNTRPAGMPVFDDLSLTPWASDAIDYLFRKDIVNGYGDGRYGVNDNVTREQFVRMLLTALNIKLVVNDESTFKDVEEEQWYTNYVNAALKLGIVTGISEEEFGIGQQISRQDMAVMCVRAMELISSEPELTEEPVATEEPEMTGAPETTVEPVATEEPGLTEAPEATEQPEATEEPETAEESEETEAPFNSSELLSGLKFADKEEISDYALKAVAWMTEKGYLLGDENGSFAPKKSLTRAETAMVLYRILIQEDI